MVPAKCMFFAERKDRTVSILDNWRAGARVLPIDGNQPTLGRLTCIVNEVEQL
jgi:hypothetical protein